MHYFSSLTPEKILESVEKYGVRCTGRILQLNSMENRVFEVEIECDDPVSRHDAFRIIKFYRPHRWSDAQILDEHQFLLDLAEKEIPVVPPIANSEGKTLLQLDFNDMRCALFLKSGGRIPQEFTDDEIEWMGRLIARMHLVGASRAAESRLILNAETYGTKNLSFLLEQNLIHPDSRAAFQGAVERIVSISTPFFNGVENTRIHGDLHLANILWDGAGPKFVDFDDMVMGPAIQDIWLCCPGRDEESLAQREVLLEGYTSMRSFDRNTLQLVEPLRTLRMIHFHAWIGSRWDDPAFQKVFSHFGTPLYWSQAVQDLTEQLSIIEDLYNS